MTATTLHEDPTLGHPFPQLRRTSWLSLNGPWGFAYDDARTGVRQGFPATGVTDRTITVPFPPESALSGSRGHVLPPGGVVLAHPWGAHELAGLREQAGEAGRVLRARSAP